MAWSLLDTIVRDKMLSLMSHGWELEPWIRIEREYKVRREDLEPACSHFITQWLVRGRWNCK